MLRAIGIAASFTLLLATAWTVAASQAVEAGGVAGSLVDERLPDAAWTLAGWFLGAVLAAVPVRRRAGTFAAIVVVAATTLQGGVQLGLDPLRERTVEVAYDSLALGAAASAAGLLRAALPAMGAGPAVLLSLGAALALATTQALFGQVRGGQTLALPIGGAGLQGVEVVKLLVQPAVLAAWLAWRDRQAGAGLPLAACGLAGVVVALVAFALGDVGGALVLLATVLLGAVAIVARGPAGPVPLLGGGALLLPAIVGAFARDGDDGVHARVRMWLDPFDNGLLHGEHGALARFAMAAGGLWGRGPGAVSPRHVYEARTDYAPAILAESWGAAGVVAWTAAMLVLFVCLLAMTRRRSPTGAALPLALALHLGVQALAGAGGVFGVVPSTGVVTPFCSASTSFALVTGLWLGAALPDASPGGQARDGVLVRLVAFAAACALLPLLGVVRVWGDPALVAGTRTALAVGRDGEPREVRDPRAPRGRSRAPAIVDARGRLLAADLPSGNRLVRDHPAWTPVVGVTRDGLTALPGTLEDRVARDFRGADLVRTGLDRHLQERAYDALERVRAELGGVRAVMHVVEIASGIERVRASAPSLRPSEVTAAHLDDRAMVGRHGWLADEVALPEPPGSIMKAPAMWAALRAGVRPTDTFGCPATVVLEHDGRHRPVHNHRKVRPRESVTLAGALVPSCNTTFASLGARLGGAALAATVEPVTGPQRVDWADPIEAGLAAIGQSRLEWTPEEASVLYAALAGGGRARRCERAWVGAPACATATLPALADPAPVAEALRAVVDEGTGRGARGGGPGWRIAGKTGTATLGRVLPDDPSSADVAWFAGVVEEEGTPRFAFAIVLARTEAGGGALAPLALKLGTWLGEEGYLSSPVTSISTSPSSLSRTWP